MRHIKLEITPVQSGHSCQSFNQFFSRIHILVGLLWDKSNHPQLDIHMYIWWTWTHIKEPFKIHVQLNANTGRDRGCSAQCCCTQAERAPDVHMHMDHVLWEIKVIDKRDWMVCGTCEYKISSVPAREVPQGSILLWFCGLSISWNTLWSCVTWGCWL